MKMSKEHIVVLVALVLVLATLGTLYYVYYLPRQKVFKANNERLAALEGAIQKFEKTFYKTKPEAIIKALTGAIGPFQQELMSRSKIYNVADFNQVDPIPENKMLRFYYTEQFNKMMNDLRREAYTRNIYIPETLNLGIMRPEDLQGRTMDLVEVRSGLKRLHFAIATLRMLMDAKPMYITEFVLWPNRKEYELLWSTTTGVTMMISYQDLANFMEKMRTNERFFMVNAISMQNPYMLWQTDPPLTVKMLITQSTLPMATGPAAGEAPGAAQTPGGPQAPGGPQVAGAPGVPGTPPVAAPQTPEEQLRNANIMPMANPKRQVTELTTGQKIKRFLRSWYLWPF